MDHLQSVQYIFSDRLFRIPDYQRGYAWEEQQWLDLLEDLELLPDESDHFTGTLAVSRAPVPAAVTDDEGITYKVYEVIDGQQRLATIVMLLDAIRDEMDGIESLKILAEGTKKRYLAVSDSVGQLLPKLCLGRDDQEFFFQNVLGFGPSIGGATLITHRRLQQAHAYFGRYLAGQRQRRGSAYPEWLRGLAAKVTKHLQMIFFEVDSEEDAFVIFETMNDRGRPITETDKVKTHLLYLATKLDLPARHGQVQHINETWGQIFRHLMRAELVKSEDEDRLLRVHWLMAYDYEIKKWEDSRSVKARFSLRAYQGRHAALLQDLYTYVETLENAAIAYADIYNPTHSNAFNGFADDPSSRTKIAKASEQLRRLGYLAPFLPLLIAARLRFPDDAEGYLRAVTLCERFAFRAYAWRNLPSSVGLPARVSASICLTASHAVKMRWTACSGRLWSITDEQFAAGFDDQRTV